MTSPITPQDKTSVPTSLSRRPVFTAEQHLNNRLYTHATRGRNEQVLAVIEQGADVHDKQDNALRTAAQAGHSTTVALLIAHGADLTAKNHHALRMAAQYGHNDVVDLLLKHGADPRAENFEALREAVLNGRPLMVKRLLDHAVSHDAQPSLDVLEDIVQKFEWITASKAMHEQAMQALMPLVHQRRIEHEQGVLQETLIPVGDPQQGSQRRRL